jgi:hypothetical protein
MLHSALCLGDPVEGVEAEDHWGERECGAVAQKTRLGISVAEFHFLNAQLRKPLLSPFPRTCQALPVDVYLDRITHCKNPEHVARFDLKISGD